MEPDHGAASDERSQSACELRWNELLSDGQTVDLNQQHASVTPNDYSRRPYPNWGRILSSENAGNANYQALQTELNQRMNHGLLLQVNHTWAKNLSNAAGDAPSVFAPEVNYGTPVADRFNLRANRGNAGEWAGSVPISERGSTADSREAGLQWSARPLR
ncbi:hypothetical protein JAO29_14440 [Edaphobacter sp. HDX4]